MSYVWRSRRLVLFELLIPLLLAFAICALVCKMLTTVVFVYDDEQWAACILRKPILNIQWLYHCFREHRCVPHEPYRLPIFTGVILCTTGISLGELPLGVLLCLVIRVIHSFSAQGLFWHTL